MPERIAQVLYIVAILANYGRHLVATLERRAAARSFSFIARCFGTATCAVIRPQIIRGLLRAAALERRLRARAANGHDLRVLQPIDHSRRQAKRPPAPASSLSLTDASTATPPALAANRASHRGEPSPLSCSDLFSVQQIEAEVRRRSIGRSIVDICRDLGVAPGLCQGSFWNCVFLAIRDYRGSFANIVLEMRRREQRFERQVLDRVTNFDWPQDTSDAIRRAMGFLIGEVPVDPFLAAPTETPVAAAATGPP